MQVNGNAAGNPPAKNMGPDIFDDLPKSDPAPAAQEPNKEEPSPKVEPEAGPGADGKQHGNEPAKDGKTEEPKKDENQPERVVPERYELKLGSDSLLHPSALARIESYAKTEKLTQEEAQDLVKLQEQDVAAAIADRKKQLLDEAVADKEIGGANLKENVILAKRFLDKHGTPELRAEFDRYGHGNHKEMIRLLSKLERKFGNDSAVISRQHGNAGGQERPFHEKFYGPDNT